MLKMELEATRLHHGITEQHKIHEQSRKQVEAMTMDLQHELNIRMKEKLAELEKSTHERLMAQKAAHRAEQLKLKETFIAEKEKLLMGNVEKKNELEKKINDAEEEQKNMECIICFEEFSMTRLRAHYQLCDHANVCYGCCDNLWKDNKKACPTCKRDHVKKPIKLPASIYY